MILTGALLVNIERAATGPYWFHRVDRCIDASKYLGLAKFFRKTSENTDYTNK